MTRFGIRSLSIGLVVATVGCSSDSQGPAAALGPLAQQVQLTGTEQLPLSCTVQSLGLIYGDRSICESLGSYEVGAGVYEVTEMVAQSEEYTINDVTRESAFVYAQLSLVEPLSEDAPTAPVVLYLGGQIFDGTLTTSTHSFCVGERVALAMTPSLLRDEYYAVSPLVVFRETNAGLFSGFFDQCKDLDIDALATLYERAREAFEAGPDVAAGCAVQGEFCPIELPGD